MGGFGSGRWGWAATRGMTDGQLRLDVRWLARRGWLDPGTAGAYAVAWSLGDRPAGDILVCYDDGRPGELVLDYRVRGHRGEPWSQVREPVPLDRTPCPYGGARVWFRCPCCLGRRAVLYGAVGRFWCRGCHDLAYSSTREGEAARHLRRVTELWRRVGCEPGTRSVRSKPKGMHLRTYDRIVAEIADREGDTLTAFVAETTSLHAHLGCKYVHR